MDYLSTIESSSPVYFFFFGIVQNLTKYLQVSSSLSSAPLKYDLSVDLQLVFTGRYFRAN